MKDKDELAMQIYKKMMEKDYFTQWLGLQLDAISDGYCKMHFELKRDMLNGFESVHGGILFSASDSVFAFACNSHGWHAVALEVSISFTKPAKEGDMLLVHGSKESIDRSINDKILIMLSEYNEKKINWKKALPALSHLSLLSDTPSDIDFSALRSLE